MSYIQRINKDVNKDKEIYTKAKKDVNKDNEIYTKDKQRCKQRQWDIYKG